MLLPCLQNQPSYFSHLCYLLLFILHPNPQAKAEEWILFSAAVQISETSLSGRSRPRIGNGPTILADTTSPRLMGTSCRCPAPVLCNCRPGTMWQLFQTPQFLFWQRLNSHILPSQYASSCSRSPSSSIPPSPAAARASLPQLQQVEPGTRARNRLGTG